MRKMIKKILAGIISATLVMAASVPVMADSGQVFVNFICDGQNSGKLVNVGSNVTAPAVPLHGGFTFCGFDKSLYNIRENTTFYAVYVDNNLGEAAIAARKASLPTPAVSPTTVADPNAAPAASALAAAAPLASNAMAVAQQNIAAAQNAVAAAQAGTQAPAATAPAAQAHAAAAPAAQAPAAAAPAAQAPAAAASAAQAPAAAAPAAQAPAAQTPATTPAAVAAPAGPVVTIPASVLPSWATPMNGVDLKGAAEVYKYWKTVKNTDDATIQSNWGALLNHYAGHGTQGW